MVTLDMTDDWVREGVRLAQFKANLSIQVATGMVHSRGSILKAYNQAYGTSFRYKDAALADCIQRQELFDMFRRASLAGAQAGHAAGTWAIDGNTSDDTCREFLRKIEDCDFDGPGPWDGTSPSAVAAEHDLPDEDGAEWHEVYEEAFNMALEAEVVRSCQAHLDES